MAAGPSSAVFLAMREEEEEQQQLLIQQQPQQQQAPQKKRRNQPGTPNPDAEIIALSPKTLMATNRFVCEVCNKGFQREQNLQLHRRGHNLPWKLKQKSTKEVKRKVYLCPEPTCVHHEPSRALGDLTGIKKHYSRKHGEKKYKCEKCSKKYAVQSDWKAHTKTCGTREYKCDCGTLFSRRDSFITHRAFCDALAQESARNPPSLSSIGSHLYGNSNNMSLGLSKMGSQISDHSNSTDILHFGSSSNIKTSGQFDHNNLMGTSMGSAFRPSTSFFLPADQTNHQDYAANKPSIHGLMQLPDLHNNANNNSSPSVASMFNLNFFQNNNNNSENVGSHGNSSISAGGGLLIPNHQFSNSSGDGSNNSSNMFSAGSLLGTDHHHISSSIPSIYGNHLNNNSTASPAPPMSATALLQKAAQMGSTTSNNNMNNSTASLLKAFGSSSSATKSDIHPPPPVNFGSVVYGDPMSGNHLHDIVVNAYDNNDQNQQNDYGNNFEQQQHQPPQKKQMLNNFSMENMGTEQANRLTRDFLGVGEIVRSMSGGFGSSHRDQQQQQQMSSLDSKAAPPPQSHHQSFGGAGNFQ